MAIESVDNGQPLGMSDEELHEIANFAPCIDDAEMERIEEISSSNAIGQNRRCMLLMLARDADMSSNFSISEPEAFGDMRECVEAYRDHVKQMLEMAEVACVRLAIADCRPDRLGAQS